MNHGNGSYWSHQKTNLGSRLEFETTFTALIYIIVGQPDSQNEEKK